MIGSSLARRASLAMLLALSAVSFVRGQAPDTQDLKATVVLRVHPDAKVTVDGQVTKVKGTMRRFVSPPLERGKKYYYTIVAEWMPNTYETFTVTRTVHVEAGKTVEEDMSKADANKGDKLFIIYVPTPPEVVEAMLKLAKVGKDDVVYDLGCGDGRIVVAAVKEFNAKHAVGIDLKQERIEEAQANAKKAGVQERVEFRKADVLKLKDLSQATVVTLYLSDDLNKMLMPKLQEQLKPGARIVSHRFRMGDWKPEKTERVPIDHPIADEQLIHLWTIKTKDGEKKEDKKPSGK
jgi:uncharacterized protein (TIGR03000 family)